MQRISLSLFVVVVLSLAAVMGASASNHNCADYPTQDDAQAAYDAGGHDDLDGDNDGIACESNAGGGSTTGGDSSGGDTSGGDTSGTGSNLPATGVGPLGSSGGAPWALLLAAIGGIMAMMGIRVRRS